MVIRALLILVLPLAVSCYQLQEGGELPAGQLTVDQYGGLGGTYGRDLLHVDIDGSFEVLSLYDARVCRGVLGSDEQQRWRAIARTLQERWVRPDEVPVIDGGSRCASVEPSGQSTGCERDGGVRRQAANFAYELRSRFGEGECEVVAGASVLVTSWSAIPLVGTEPGVSGWIDVEWRDGRARFRPIAESDEWSDCPAPTSEQSAQLDALAHAALDAMPLPRPNWYSSPRDPPDSAWFELSQLLWVSAFVDSPYGLRGNRLVGERTAEFYRDIGVALAELCQFATVDPRR